MAILNYSSVLQGGGLGAGQRAVGLAGMLQNQQAQRQQMQMQQDAQAAQQQAMQQDAQARELGAQLLREGTPEQIAEFGIKNPTVMKDFVAAANFQDQQAETGRLNYAKDILSGNVNPKAALQSRIAEVEARGGDAQGLYRTLEAGTDEAIIDAARKDFAVLDPQGYKTYQQITGEVSQQQKPTAGIAEYEYVKGLSPEEKDEFFKVKRGEKPSPEQQMRLEQEKSDLAVKTEQTKAERKAGVQALSGIAKSQKSARQNLGTINRLKSLNKKAFSGLAANERLAIAKAAKSFGIPIEGVSESEQLKALSNELVLNKSQQMSGALSNADMQFLLDTAPTLSQSAEGRGKMLEYADALAKREIEYAKAAQKFRKENGYFDQLQFEQEFDAENKPLFEDEVIEQSAVTVTAPVGQEFTSSGGIKYKVIE